MKLLKLKVFKGLINMEIFIGFFVVFLIFVVGIIPQVTNRVTNITNQPNQTGINSSFILLFVPAIIIMLFVIFFNFARGQPMGENSN